MRLRPQLGKVLSGPGINCPWVLLSPLTQKSLEVLISFDSLDYFFNIFVQRKQGIALIFIIYFNGE